MRNFDVPKEEIIKCYHCGNETKMLQVGEYKWNDNDADFSFYYYYQMFVCPVCNKITLRETYSDDSMRYCDIEDYEQNIIYPIINIDNKFVPKKIVEAFEASLKTKYIDKNICLMGLRRTLELILNDKGATKWGLKNKIEEIADKGLLPSTLKEASSFTKIFGDSAAHDKEIEIDQDDVESMSEFIKYIIEYLYIVPNKINSYKEKFSLKEIKT